LWPGDDAFRLFTEGDELYAAMHAAINGAKREIALESYIFADDEVGRALADVLAERARAGIDVRVHLDAAGSLFWASRKLDRFLRDNDVTLRWYHRWHWSQPLRYNQRNHRKLLVVDQRQAFLGGFNIHRENSRRYYGERRWRDTHVAMAGNQAKQAQAAFEALWQRCHWQAAPETDSPSAVVLPNKTADCAHRLRCIFAAMFASAQHHIEVTTPYFVPDGWTQRALGQAAERGVSVRLLVPRKSDVAPIRWIARRIYARLQCRGVRVFGYHARLLHAKTVTVDGDWASVGTANLDYRSLFVNHELNLCARNRKLASTLTKQFETDLASAVEFSTTWPRQRMTARMLAPLAWAARRWL
jgi:cardiolipin synthase